MPVLDEYHYPFEQVSAGAAGATLKSSHDIQKVREVSQVGDLAVEEFQRFWPQEQKVVLLTDTFVVTDRSIVDLAEQVALLSPDRATIFPMDVRSGRSILCINSHAASLPFVVVIVGYGSRRMTDVTKREITVTVVATPPGAKNVMAWFDETFAKSKKASIKFHYTDNGCLDHTTIVLDDPPKIHPEFYPYFSPSPMVSFAKFLESEAQLLFLSGPPGTGKTSFLRAMIFEHSLRVGVAYDSKLLSQDRLFVDFLSEDEDDILIFEDAETLITEREQGNHLISKFLNITDGIIKVKKKKIVFTTNSARIDQVDAALTRPGRCFGVFQFQELSFPQAEVVARITNRALPEKKDYTLAEIFNIDQKQFQPFRVGFRS